jgi:putative CocE/NonD family hydrolase
MIPMRDGVRLFTVIYAPRDTTRLHPFVMTRTPYSVGPYGADRMPRALPYIPNAYAHEGMIQVLQDVRGRWMSEGEFVDVRPVVEHRTSKDVDETTDAYDTVDWLIKNVPFNNGRVGVRGTSYPGFYAEMAAIGAHPAVKVVSPQAPVTEWMGGDDFFHHGALLEPHFLDFFYGFGHPRPVPTSDRRIGAPALDHVTPDGFAYYLRLGALSNVNPRMYHDSVAFWDSIVAHPMWDGFWAARSGRPHLHDIRPAVLWVGGWFDTENLWGALHAYAAAERQSPGTENRLVMGPWSHGQWNSPAGDSLGRIAWGTNTTRFYGDSIEVPFFNYYLLDSQPAPRAFEAAVFETGRNQWHFADAWPPAGATPRTLYLHSSGALRVEPPRARGRAFFDEYVSDPARPVPYTAEVTHWYNSAFMVEDQRFAARRPDVLVYQTAALDSDLTVAGPITVDFVISTTGTDCDLIVKVIDVFPDDYGRSGAATRRTRSLGGYQMLVRGDVMRGKYRNSFSKPEPFRPGVPTAIRFTLSDVYHTFQAGHRLMVQVQSTWFPMIDRNPGRFEDIFRAKDTDFRRTTQRVYRSADYPSHLVLPVLRP